jgi:hypothetical protein
MSHSKLVLTIFVAVALHHTPVHRTAANPHTHPKPAVSATAHSFPRPPNKPGFAPPGQPVWAPFVIPTLTFLGGGGLGALLYRYLDRSSRRTAAKRQAAFHLRGLEKQMSIARDFPGVTLWAYDELTIQLRAVILSSDATGVLADREFDSTQDALTECEDVGQYLSQQPQNQPIPTAHLRNDMIAAATRALTAVYRARSVLNDGVLVKWPSDPRNRRLWEVGGIIPRTDQDS